MKPEITAKIAGYSRKSKFTGKGKSIENQVELCRQYVKTHFPGGSEAELVIYEDEGYSGGHTDRPKSKGMMNDAQSGKLSNQGGDLSFTKPYQNKEWEEFHSFFYTRH